MRLLLYFFIISMFAFCSCDTQNRKDHKISILGKWHRFSVKNGYTEFHIDSQYMIYFNQKTGRSKLEYKIQNDSFKYCTQKYAAKFIAYGDSIFFQGNDGSTATLYRFNEPDTPFDSIPEEKDSLFFNPYIKGFDKRLMRAWEKSGIKFFDKKEEQNDTTQVFQQLRKLKKR